MHHYNMRQSVHDDFYLVRKNVVQYDVTFIQYMGATLWNDLLVEFRNSSSKFLLKRAESALIQLYLTSKNMN